MALKLAPHEWIRSIREDKGIRQSDVEKRSAEFGAKISQSHLSKIEKGNAPLAGLGAERMDALRRALDLTPEDWVSHTGLRLVVKEESEEYSSVATHFPGQSLKVEYRDGAPVAVLPITSSNSLPQALQEAIELYGRRFSDLNDPVWQQYLAGFRWRDGEPEDPEAWLDLYRDLTRAGVVPGSN